VSSDDCEVRTSYTHHTYSTTDERIDLQAVFSVCAALRWVVYRHLLVQTCVPMAHYVRLTGVEILVVCVLVSAALPVLHCLPTSTTTAHMQLTMFVIICHVRNFTVCANDGGYITKL